MGHSRTPVTGHTRSEIGAQIDKINAALADLDRESRSRGSESLEAEMQELRTQRWRLEQQLKRLPAA